MGSGTASSLTGAVDGLTMGPLEPVGFSRVMPKNSMGLEKLHGTGIYAIQKQHHHHPNCSRQSWQVPWSVRVQCDDTHSWQCLAYGPRSSDVGESNVFRLLVRLDATIASPQGTHRNSISRSYQLCLPAVFACQGFQRARTCRP